MPLDAAGTIFDLQTEVIDPLTKIGITPIPMEIVEDHKKTFMREWHKTLAARRRPGPFEWKTIRHAFWRSENVYTRGKSGDVGDFLKQPFLYGGRAHDDGTAPKRLIALARYVEEKLPGAKFEVEYFDIDPILHVRYPHAGEMRTAALGIWQNGWLDHIAKYENAISPVGRFVERWWFGNR